MKAETAFYVFRSNGELTAEAIQARIASVYLQAEADLDALEKGASQASDTRRVELTRTAFGFADLAGSNPANQAAFAMNYRDAQTRAAQVDEMDQYGALQMLAQAEAVGDELLARALGARAWELGSLGLWSAVLDAYLNARPAAARAVTELSTLSRPGLLGQLVTSWALEMPVPPELQGLAPWQIQALAARAAS